MYFNEYEAPDYDEDDFFYHMYFDEVSTTPLPIDQIYDILESVSAGSNPDVITSPDDYDYNLDDYSDYNLDSYPSYSDYYDLGTKALNDTLDFFRNRIPRRQRQRQPRMPRTNGKMARWKRDVNGVRKRSKRSVSDNNYKKTGKRLRIKKVNINNKRNKIRRKVVNDPRVIGILDRRIPPVFRQSEFVTISLTKFVVLSTGVTQGRLLSGRGLIF